MTELEKEFITSTNSAMKERLDNLSKRYLEYWDGVSKETMGKSRFTYAKGLSAWLPESSEEIKNLKPEGITSGEALLQLNSIVFTNDNVIQKRKGYEAVIQGSVGCRHSWKTYQGFTDTYDFCEKCDQKK